MGIPMREPGRGVLQGAFAVLDVLSTCETGAGLSQLARATGLPKATAHRLLQQLSALEVVQYHDQRYFIGRQLARLGRAWQPDPRLQRAGREPLRRLSALSATVASVTVLDGERIRVVAATRGVLSDVPPIRADDEYARDTAAGRILMLSADPATGERLGSDLSRGEWHSLRSRYRDTGWLGFTHPQVLAGVSCAAVPVRDADGTVVASVSALALTRQVPPGLGELVLRASREIARNLTLA
jgi:DNA-binding IclR family transcriptional regulator